MKAKLHLQRFEERVVPAVAIDSGYEAYAWVLINTLRQNPSAFANNLQGLIDNTVDSAFGFARTDPVIADLRGMKNRGSQANYTATLALMRSTGARGPLAWEELLEDRADNHNEWMKRNGFSHTGSTGGGALPGYSNTAGEAADTFGYPNGRYSAWGENISYGYGQFPNTTNAYNTGSIGMTGLVQRAAFLDTVGYMLELYSSSLGHLQNLIGSGFNAIGLDIDLYEPGAADGVPDASVSTHRPAQYRPGGTGGFVAGVVYTDANGNGFYDNSEGASLTVTVRDANGAGFTDTLTAADRGAFSEYLANGAYTLTVSDGGTPVATRTLTINNSNAWAAVDADAAQPPAEPVLSGPSASPTALRPAVTWSAVPDATSYQVRLENVTTGIANLFPTATATGTSWTPPSDLVSGQAYRVTVRAMSGSTAGDWSDPRNFTVARATVTAPGNLVTLRPTVTWTGIAGATAYRVVVNDRTTGAVNIFPNARVTGTSWTPAVDLVSGRKYQVQIRALNGAGLGLKSDAVTFTLAKPTPSGPAGDVSDRTPTFGWSGIAGATKYQVRIDNLTTGVSSVRTATVAGPSWTPGTDLAVGQRFRWSVRAVNAAGLGAWTTGTEFRVV